MRIAPLAFVLDPLSTSDRVVIRDVCRITHHSDEAYVGALAVLLAVHSRNAMPPSSPSSFAAHLPDSRVRDRLLAFEDLSPGSALATVAERFGSSGYVVETVPLALFTAARITGSSFESLLGELLAAGGDTDTIGSIAGQVAGARIGFSKYSRSPCPSTGGPDDRPRRRGVRTYHLGWHLTRVAADSLRSPLNPRLGSTPPRTNHEIISVRLATRPHRHLSS